MDPQQFQILQMRLSVGVSTMAALIGILINIGRSGGLRVYMGSRVDHLEKLFDARFSRGEKVLHARLKHLGQRP